MRKPALTKSRFALGLRCPQKIVCEQEYPSQLNAVDSDFLSLLAEGGFQVGAFAKAHFPDGSDLSLLDTASALIRTKELISSGDCTIFEAAFSHGNCLVRVDILECVSDKLIIHEVKAKSFDSSSERPLQNKDGALKSVWKPFLYDVAFQKYVVSRAFVGFKVSANLMLVDKASKSPISGLHQCFKIVGRAGKRTAIQVLDIPHEVLSAGLLRSIDVDAECDLIFEATEHGIHFDCSFSDLVDQLSTVCENLVAPGVLVSEECGSCEFRSSSDDGTSSGFAHCMATKAEISDFSRGDLIFDLWNNRRIGKQLASGIIKLKDLEAADLGHPDVPVQGVPLTTKQRQWLQISKLKTQDPKPWIDAVGLQKEMDRWQFPLHFIDFETSRVALPFFKNQSPYHNVAFQFSHHTIHIDGRVEHAHQFLSANPLVNPNLDFVRSLRAAIGGDQGTIFMYSQHENSTLCAIHKDLEEHSDAEVFQLREFIESITIPAKDAPNAWQCSRPMVDLLKLIQSYVYFPSTQGNNSIKAILPAILSSSDFLQATYSDPIYGKDCSVPSLNFDPISWVRRGKKGEILSPYSQLPDIGADLSDSDREELAEITKIDDGGAALAAFARLTIGALGDTARKRLEQSLLMYCELDTLAMVFLYQGLIDLMGNEFPSSP